MKESLTETQVNKTVLEVQLKINKRNVYVYAGGLLVLSLTLINSLYIVLSVLVLSKTTINALYEEAVAKGFSGDKALIASDYILGVYLFQNQLPFSIIVLLLEVALVLSILYLANKKLKR